MRTSVLCVSILLSSACMVGPVARAEEPKAAPPAPVAAQAEAAEGEPRRVPLDVGTVAPDFSLPSATGETVTLSSFHGKQTVVLYFYPKDNTPGCTKEAQDFRDDYDRFKRAGAVVLGVSVDDVPSHKGFTNKNTLNFPLLADAGGKVARLYGVMGWIMAKRVSYVIGRDGKVKYVDPEVDVTNHSKKMLKIVQDLGAGPAKSKAKNPPSAH